MRPPNSTYASHIHHVAVAVAVAVAGACTAAGSFSHPAGLRERPVFRPGARVAGGPSLLPFTTCSSGLLPACLVASRLARHSARACCLSMVLMATSGQRIPLFGHGATCWSLHSNAGGDCPFVCTLQLWTSTRANAPAQLSTRTSKFRVLA